MKSTHEITDISTEAKADEIVQSYTSEGCVAVKEQQLNGKWTVRAECPPTEV